MAKNSENRNTAAISENIQWSDSWEHSHAKLLNFSFLHNNKSNITTPTLSLIS